MDPFWKTVDTCLDELESAPTADAVIGGLNKHFAEHRIRDGAAGAAAFFPGSGGDRQLLDSLEIAGWKLAWAEAPYFYAARDRDGELITYVEGDVYRGDCR